MTTNTDPRNEIVTGPCDCMRPECAYGLGFRDGEENGDADLKAAERERDEEKRVRLLADEHIRKIDRKRTALQAQLTEVEGLLREATDNNIPGTGKSWHEPPCEVCIGCRVRAYFTKHDGGKP